MERCNLFLVVRVVMAPMAEGQVEEQFIRRVVAITFSRLRLKTIRVCAGQVERAAQRAGLRFLQQVDTEG